MLQADNREGDGRARLLAPQRALDVPLNILQRLRLPDELVLSDVRFSFGRLHICGMFQP